MHDIKVRGNLGSGRSSLRAFGLLAALSLAVPPLMGATPPVSGAAADESVQAAQAERVAVGDEAVDFSLDSIDGETHGLADLRGEKNAIIIFFRGTW